MNRVLFEGRFLISMISTQIQKGSLQVRYGRMDWERMFRVSDYHRVSSIIYLGLIGNGGQVPERWQNRFFERYQESLLYGQSCETAEREILALLDMENIPCIVLASTTVRRMYELPETADLSPLRLYLSPEGYTLVKGYLVDLGYETVKTYPEFGERMHQVSGFNVDIYKKLPFKTRFYETGMRELMMRARIRDGGTAVRIFRTEDRFLFRMASVAYQYVTDELLIRDMLDLFLYHKACRRQLNEQYVAVRLKDFRIDGLAEKLLRLAYMWFGTKEDREYMQYRPHDNQIEDLTSFDFLENRIFSRGEFQKEKEADKDALALAKLLQKEEDRENRQLRWKTLKTGWEEWKKKTRRSFRWVFPEYKYMVGMYPVLEKVPLLLPFYWLIRDLRLLGQLLFKGGKKEKNEYSKKDKNQQY